MSLLPSFCLTCGNMGRYICPHTHVHSQHMLTYKPGVYVTGLPGDRTDYTIQTSLPKRPQPMGTQLNSHLPRSLSYFFLFLFPANLRLSPSPRISLIYEFIPGCQVQIPTPPLSNYVKQSNCPQLFTTPPSSFGKHIQ